MNNLKNMASNNLLGIRFVPTISSESKRYNSIRIYKICIIHLITTQGIVEFMSVTESGR